MYFVITRRVVKHNTGSTAKFEPRTSNTISVHVSGPFTRLKAAERAALLALGTHTCLAARVWSQDAIMERLAGSWSEVPHDEWRCFKDIENDIQRMSAKTEST